MDTIRRSDQLLDLARVLLLFQGALLIATTIEALVWSAVFAGATASSALFSGAAAAVIFVGRARLRADRRASRRLVHATEVVILVIQAIDIALSLALAHSFPPLVPLLTQVALPIAVIVVLRRWARAARSAVPAPQVALERAA
jgi:hypothetical protein